MTSQFLDMMSLSNFFEVAVFLLSSLVTGPSFMPILWLVIELWQFCMTAFVSKGWTRNPEIGTPFTLKTFTCSNSTRETLEKGVKYVQSLL